MFVLSVAVLLFFLSTLPVPSLPPAECGSLAAYDKDGEERWRARWRMEQITEERQALVRFTESGEGETHGFEEPVRWELESLWIYDSRFSPQKYMKQIRDLNGNLLVTERFSFDWGEGKAQFERVDHVEDRKEEERFDVPADTITTDGIAAALRGLRFASRQEFRAHLLTNEPKLYEVTFQSKEQESVSTPAGTFECYKVGMDVDLGFLNLFKIFASNIYFWYTVNAPHFWIRYRGPESGRGSPTVTRVRLSPPSETDPGFSGPQ